MSIHLMHRTAKLTQTGGITEQSLWSEILWPRNLWPQILWTMFMLVLTMTLCLPASSFAKATVRLINLDTAGQGLNDDTAATPVGNNSGTTLGEQRRIALEYTASLLSIILDSDVPIEIGISFTDLGGTALSAPLAQSGPNTYHYDFTGALVEKSWYAQALANKLAGTDLFSSQDCTDAQQQTFLCYDVLAEFNSSIDSSTILVGSSWYYGLDGPAQSDDPDVSGNFDLVTVALHELLHGMGFISLVNTSTGAFFFSTVENRALPDRYSALISLSNGSPSSFESMTNAQRAQALKANGDNSGQSNVVWSGSTGNTIASESTRGTYDGQALIYAPDPVESGATLSHLDTRFTPSETMEPFYTEATHEIGVAAGMMADMGWGAASDLALSIASSANPSPINQAATYQFAISNHGPETAPDTTVIYDLPSATALQSAQPDSCTTQSSRVTCSLGALASDSTTTLTLTLAQTSLGTLTHTAEVYGSIVDSSPLNNSAEIQTRVNDDVIPNVSANAGNDQSGTGGDTITIDARQSQVINGSINDYSFEQVNGTGAVIEESSEGQATVTLPDSQDSVVIKVTVTDNDSNSSSDFVVVSVNAKPSANAGQDVSVSPGEQVTLSGVSSTDGDGSISSYQWQQTGGNTVTLIDATSATPSFTAPTEETSLVFSLTVTDDEGATATDTITVTVTRAAQSSSSGGGCLTITFMAGLLFLTLVRLTQFKQLTQLTQHRFHHCRVLKI